MVAIPGDEHVGLLEDGPELAEILLEEARILVGRGIVYAYHRNVQIRRVIRAHVLEEILGFQVECDLAHAGYCNGTLHSAQDALACSYKDVVQY